MFKKALVTLSLILISNLAMSQNYFYENDFRAFTVNAAQKLDLSLIGASTGYSSRFKQNPLVFENWQYGRIYFNKEQHFDSLLMNFDSDLNTLVVKLEGNKIISVSNRKAIKFKFYNGQTTEFMRFDGFELPGIKNKRIYGESISNTTEQEIFQLIKVYNKHFKDAKYSMTNYGRTSESEYILKYAYYIKIRDAGFQEISVSKSGIKKLFGKKKAKDAATFVKKEGLDWKNEEDFKRILVYIID